MRWKSVFWTTEMRWSSMFPSSTTSKKVRITTADVATSTTGHLDLAPATACTIRQLSVLCSSSTRSRRTWRIESVESSRRAPRRSRRHKRPCARRRARRERHGSAWRGHRSARDHVEELKNRVVVTETAEAPQSIDKLPLVKRSASSRSQAELRALLTRLIGSLAAAQARHIVCHA